MEKLFNEMNAIACGVEARYNLFVGYSNIVTKETVDIARHLGMPEKEIQSWVVARAAHDSDASRAVKTIVTKLELNPVTRRILAGLTEPQLYTSNPVNPTIEEKKAGANRSLAERVT